MNRENFEILERYLLTRPREDDQFHMRECAFTVDPETGQDESVQRPDLVYPECGTVCCAAGMGPAAGLVPRPYERWPEYISRIFATTTAEDLWCFGRYWSEVDNTPHGAAARIRWMLDHGVPGNYAEQMAGASPLCYTVPEPAQTGDS